MTQRLLIVLNGLKEFRGHYLELGLAIAEASEQLGLHPVLATHVECPSGLIPDGIDYLPIFAEDNWICGNAPPDLFRMRGDVAAYSNATAKKVKDGDSSVRQLLEAHFDLPKVNAFDSALKKLRQCRLRSLIAACLPPLTRRSLSWVRKKLKAQSYFTRFASRGYILAITRKAIQECLPPFVKTCSRSLFSSHAALTPHLFAERSGIPSLLHMVAPFQRDLERFLCLAGFTPTDHVFLATANAHELLAVQNIVNKLPLEKTPRFHLQFYYPIAMPVLPHWRAPTPREHAEFTFRQSENACFALYKKQGHKEQVRLYAAPKDLAEEHSHVTGLPFEPLSVIFRHNNLPKLAVAQSTPRNISFIGDARSEKGFHLLPDLIEGLSLDYIRNRKLRFLIQAYCGPAAEDTSIHAIERLADYPKSLVRLISRNRPLTPYSYYKLLGRSDIVVLPYDPIPYVTRSSGVFAEALAAGKVTIVPAHTAMARRQPELAGETFTDVKSLITAVKRCCDNFETYHRNALAQSQASLNDSSPLQLVKTLLATSTRLAAEAA